MLIFIHHHATGTERTAVMHALAAEPHGTAPISNGDVIAVAANSLTAATRERIAALPAVARVVAVPTAYKLVSRMASARRTQVRVGFVVFGDGGPPPVIAGPCSVENEAQIIEAAQAG
ncbi:MAG: hypothetical protein H0X24_17200 [Ktedonobacterales bacterium]|nr:hypothetical protein [Ktedonobacterales bacterium]